MFHRKRFVSSVPSGYLLLPLLVCGCGPDGPTEMVSPDPGPRVIYAISAVTTVEIDAVVTSVADAAGDLGGAIATGAPLTGFLEFDDSVADQHNKDDTGRYVMSGPPSRIRVSAGGLTFESDPAAPGLTVQLLNDRKTSALRDTFDADGRSNLDVMPGVGVSTIGYSLSDDTATALSSDALAGLDIDLQRWTDGGVVITGAAGWRIEAVLTAFAGGHGDDPGDMGTRKLHAERGY